MTFFDSFDVIVRKAHSHAEKRNKQQREHKVPDTVPVSGMADQAAQQDTRRHHQTAHDRRALLLLVAGATTEVASAETMEETVAMATLM